MESNRQKNQPQRRSSGQKIVILLGSVTLLSGSLGIPLMAASAQGGQAPDNNSFAKISTPSGEISIANSPETNAPEQLAAPVLIAPNAPLASEQIIQSMREESPATINSGGNSASNGAGVPVLMNPVDNFADRNDYGLTPPSNPQPRYSRLEAPEAIVLNERSTGCTNVLVNGAVPNKICATPEPLAVPNPPVANLPSTLQPVNIMGIEVAPGGFRLASNSSANTKGSSSFLPQNRPVGRPGAGRGTFMFPLTIPAVITSLFGWRIHPISGSYSFHSGTDLGADQGTPVIAVTDGKVAIADFMGGYGLTVVLRHEQETHESLYAHMSQIFVKPGDEVTQGTVIGLVGSTGNSTGPHLHFEWRTATNNGWVTVDPTAHLQYALDQFILALTNPTANPSVKPLFSSLPKAAE